jgi:uncharacterized lipoprotein
MIGIRLIGTFFVALLTGCAAFQSSSQDNWTQAQSISETKLPHDGNSNIETYYPIPPVSMAPMVQPNVLPPGSEIARTQAQSQARVMPQRSSVVASSASAIILNSNYDQAWQQVGRALRASGYKIMQQDSSLGSYYVLDLASSGGKLKDTTPIYQVHLANKANNVAVNVLNEKSQVANTAVSSRILGAIRSRL